MDFKSVIRSRVELQHHLCLVYVGRGALGHVIHQLHLPGEYQDELRVRYEVELLLERVSCKLTLDLKHAWAVRGRVRWVCSDDV